MLPSKSGVYFTADLHLGHSKLVERGHRPFASVEEMDDRLIDNINSVVARSDRLYILGDFSMGNKETVRDQRARINCSNVYLIRGNHDRLSDGQYEDVGFFYKGDLAELNVGANHIVMCHYAMRRWNRSHYGAWHLYGHSHGQLEDDPRLFAFDVGVDCFDFKPLSFEQVQVLMAQRLQAFADDDIPREKQEAQRG